MKVVESWFIASDGEKIFYKSFFPNKEEVKYVVQLVHGRSEHSGRYNEFAEFFTARGIAVYASDHRGHGRTAKSLDDIGVWNYKNAWSLIVDDIKQLNDIAEKENSQKDVFILGHSMGSLLVTTFLTKYCSGVKGAILTGIGYFPTRILIPACIFSRLQCLILGSRHRAKFIDKHAFNVFNKDFDKPFEWLTRDKKIVEKYRKDPFCGGVFTCSFYKHLFLGLMYNNKKNNLSKISKDLPLILMAGTDDPVGNFGKSVEIQKEKFMEAGLKNVSLTLYEDARHEILNEINYKEVYQDIFIWMNNCRDL